MTASPLKCPPLWGTQRSPERATLGPHIAEVAAPLGKPLLPHQRLIVDVAGEIDPDTGLLAYSQVVVVGPRQVTGKTELILPVLAHRCLGVFRDGAGVPQPQRVIYTAQTADMARMKWRDVHLPRILASRKIRAHLANPSAQYGGARLRLNAEAMLWRNGSVWSPISTTGKTGGTGDTLDLGVIDEAWANEDARTELSMRPAMLTRDWRQTWVMSMVPGLSRKQPNTWSYLLSKIELGKARVEADVRHGTAFFMWAAPDGADPGAESTWWSCMPALGHTTRVEAVRDDFESEGMSLVDFCAEYLGWIPGGSTPRWTLISQDTWGRLRDPLSAIDGGHALGVEISEDRTHGWIGAAGRRSDGHWHGEVVEPGHKEAAGVVGVDWMLPRLLELCDDGRPVTVVVDPSRPANSLIIPLRNHRCRYHRTGIDVSTPNSRQMAAACGRFYDATGQEPREDDTGVRIFHLGQPELDRALAGARKLDRGEGAFTFVKKGSVSDLGALYCVVEAMFGHELKGALARPRPQVF